MKVAKYQNAYETLRSEILGGRYSSRNPFPSVMGAGRRFGMSRLTTVKVFDMLKADGLICARSGSGTFITRAARSRTIGLIVPDHERSEFFLAIVREISRLAQAEGYSLLFGEVSATTDAEKTRQVVGLAEDFIAQGVSGVICQPIDYIKDSEAVNRKVLVRFDEANIPVVLCDYDYVDSPARSGYDVVGVNNSEAGALVVNHLRKVGAKNIRFYLRPLAPQSHRNFIRGAFNAYRDHARAQWKDHVLTCDADDIDAVRRYFRKYRPDALVCGNDSAAATLKKSLGKIGLCVPRDLLLTGMDDLQIASLLTPPLTTVHLPCEQIAEAAFCRLLARMANPKMPATELFLPVRLIVRDSTKRNVGDCAYDI